MRKILAFAAAAFVVSSVVFALDATWVHTNTAAGASWYDASNWIDPEGNTPELPPTNSTDTATLAPLPHEYAVQEPVVRTPQTAKDGVNSGLNPRIASLAGERSYRVEHTQRQSGVVTVARQMYIGNPDSFLGFLSVGDARASYAFGATPSYSPLVNNLNPYRRVGIEVTDAGSTVKVARVASDGMIEKTGAGAIAIGSSAGMGNGMYLKAGSVELSGEADDDGAIDAILANALLHLDASAASTLETNQVDETGNVCVTRWSDVRGDGWPYAEPSSFTGSQWYQIAKARTPYVADETSPSGLRMVSFGSNVNLHGDRIGPTNCMLKLSTTFTTVREAYAVILAPMGMGSCTVLGDDDKVDLVHYDSGYFGYSSVVDELMIDGKHTRNGMTADEVASMSNAFVSAVLTARDCEVSFLGSDRYYIHRTGGFRLGELILLDTAVTDVQRQMISRRLAEKWLGRPGVALGHVIAADGTTLSVPEGRTARVGTVSASGGTLVKEGGGTLSIGHLEDGASMTVDVEGGAIAFAAESTVDPSAPAAGAGIWLDATKTFTFADANTHEGSDSTYYGTWKDWRDGVDKAATWPGLTTNEPFLVENAGGAGLHALSFGLQGAANGSWMKLPGFDNDSTTVYAGFIVCRPNLTGFSMNVFGSSTIEMRRETTGKLLSSSYVQVKPYSAVWSVNGAITDPFTQRRELQQTKDFVVISFSGTEAMCVNALCKDRIHPTAYINNCGGLQVGELILYNRRLSESERMGTEAYLMEKWLGTAHPASLAGGRHVKAVSFATNVAVSVSGEETTTIGEVTGGDGTVVKGGGGTIKIDSIGSGITSIDVRGGVLDVSPTAIGLTPRFRFDASAEGTLEYQVVDNGDGTSRTNITKWLDADGNGMYATVPAKFDVCGGKDGALIFTNPTLVSVESRTGIVKPAIDFGPTSGHYTTTHHEGTSGMKICGSDGKDVGGNICCIREAFIVWQDREDCALSGYGYSHLLNDSSAYHYHRNGTKILTNNAGTQMGTKDGYVAVDGTQVPYNTAIDAKVHVVNFAHTNSTAINRIVWDRTSNAGGARVFEMICYTNELTVAQRKHIERHLMNKWLGAPSPVYTNMCSSVNIAAGATLRMAATDAIVSSDVALGGTIDGAAGVSGVGSLTIPCENGIPVQSVQSVPFTFTDGVVSVTLEGFDAKAFSRAGFESMVVFEAPAFYGNATFSLANAVNRCYPASLAMSGARLVLTVRRPGTAIHLR